MTREYNMIVEPPDEPPEGYDYLIWSFEHDRWWAPNRGGYVARQADAGRYQLTDALSICRNANITGRANEAVVPIPRRQAPP
jgi:hypothetical protein